MLARASVANNNMQGCNVNSLERCCYYYVIIIIKVKYTHTRTITRFCSPYFARFGALRPLKQLGPLSRLKQLESLSLLKQLGPLNPLKPLNIAVCAPLPIYGHAHSLSAYETRDCPGHVTRGISALSRNGH